MTNLTITVDMGKRCPQCGKPGATKLDDGKWGICMKCMTKKINYILGKPKGGSHEQRAKHKAERV